MTMTDSDPITLAQAVTAGLFPSIDAARKASTRDSRFPAPVAKMGQAFLYDAAALRAYRGGDSALPLIPSGPPPAALVEGREWKPIPGAGYYEASHRGKVRSVDRFIDGKPYRGQELSTRLNNQGYVLVDIRLDDGTRKTFTMHTLVLRTHDREPGPGEETLHGPGGPEDNRWPENIRWGTRKENLADMAAARPPREPKAPKECPRCGREHNDRGRRCQECVEALGQAAAPLIEETLNLERVAKALDYPSPEGLFGLAVRYGGLRVHTGPCPVTVRDPQPPASWLRRVMFRREASRQDSDAR